MSWFPVFYDFRGKNSDNSGRRVCIVGFFLCGEWAGRFYELFVDGINEFSMNFRGYCIFIDAITTYNAKLRINTLFVFFGPSFTDYN